MLLDTATNSREIIQARASVARYQEMVTIFINAAKRNISMNEKDIREAMASARGEEEAEKRLNESRLARITELAAKQVTDAQKISGKRNDLKNNQAEIAACDDEKLKEWARRRIYAEWRLWGTWFTGDSGGWWPKDSVSYDGIPYDDYEESLENAERIDSAIDRINGKFWAKYQSSSSGDCRGYVYIKLKHKNFPDTIEARKDAVKKKESIEPGIASLEQEMTADEKTIAELKAAIGTTKTKEQKEATVEKYKKEKLANEAKEKLYQGLLAKISDVQRIYEENRKSIDTCYRVAQMLTVNRQPGVARFMEIYEQSNAETGTVELPHHCVDSVTFDVLLDPVLTQCGHVFNRVTIDTMLSTGHGNTNCPLCRAVINKDGLRKIPLGSFIDEYVDKIVSATDTAQGLQSVANLFQLRSA